MGRNREDEIAKVAPEEALDIPQPKQLDAGALFVLKSKGSWLHCGYHLITAVVDPPILSLPYAMVFLGWEGGITCLIIGALVTFYSYNLLSLVLEHHAHKGNRLLRFTDMANHILGPRWGKYFVGPIQFLVCYGAVVSYTLLGGQCMKEIYILSSPNGSMKLYEFIIIFGGLMLILAQIPSFHSLRHINLISTILCLAYSACATTGSIHIGKSSKELKDYSLLGDAKDKTFGVFNGIAVIASAYGNGIIPETQATIAAPVKGKMFKGLCVCYAVTITTFFSVAISGYWAFGNRAEGFILGNFQSNGKFLVPKNLILITNIFTLLQLSAAGVLYLQPTNEVLERAFSDPCKKEFSARNVIPRLISRSLSVIIATTTAAMLPFFGDINSMIGAFGYMPLDFVLPVVFYNATFKPSKTSFIFWLNVSIASVFSVLGVVSSVAAVRQIALDANTYKLFADVVE
ncbi:Transmembrane amino acid transporter family protein [Euphorbia peplus]|nr:Transmembrane amino acid transporter family protein [Euphorbia peplus]